MGTVIIIFWVHSSRGVIDLQEGSYGWEGIKENPADVFVFQ